jgi:phage portal protein BeeE
MAFENFKRKIALNYLEKKGSAYSPLLFNFLTNDFTFAQNSGRYLEYYCQVAPVGDAINKIANETASVLIMPYAKAEKEARLALTNSSFVKTFRKPNFKQTGIDFKQEGFIHYLATGNNYIYLSGVLSADKRSIYQEPIEVYNLRPDYISPVQDCSGYPQYYLYNPNGKQKCFRKDYINNINGQLIEAYVEEDGFGVLLHWKEPSNNQLFSMLYGDSFLQNVEIEINQYLEASIHNANLLKNGLSSKMLFSPKDGSNPTKSRPIR